MRIVDFSDGFSSALAPTLGGFAAVTGTRASPTLITAVGGITPTGQGIEIMFVAGSGGPIDVSANPQIAAGTQVGQQLVLVGRDDTNTVYLEDGNGLKMNGPVTLSADSTITFVWDTVSWVELNRNDL